MARKSGWRQVCPDPVRNRQLLALFGSSRLFLVRQNGPAAFALQEEGRKKPLVVRLGDPHSCSCRTYRQEHELCLHICWTLLRKLRLKPEDPLSFQRGLVPHELNDLVQGTYVYHSRVKKKNSKPTDTVQPKPISNQDLCPICLEEMMKARRPGSFQVGAKNSVQAKTFCNHAHCSSDVLPAWMRKSSAHCVHEGGGTLPVGARPARRKRRRNANVSALQVPSTVLNMK
ncbi:hypothetical protein ANN_16152 [Periplaneta americana]|uniref:SWIM-type domain-containing protein n=1 Tax=Periplaneta americana TaxID=6978 RepID=A0ABQ8SI65_PERAM|nr:hypothetical protein ANN_16152 [Periplaneta americana]